MQRIWFAGGRPAGELIWLNLCGVPIHVLGLLVYPPSRRRVECTYQKSSLLYESGLGLKLGAVLDFLTGPAGRAGWPGREPGDGICY